MKKEIDIAVESEQLLNLLEIRKSSNQVSSDSGLEKIKGAGSAMSVKFNNVKVKNLFQPDGFGGKAAAFASLNGLLVGISPKNYPKLKEVALMCAELESFKDRADFEFIELKIFDWLIENYQNKSIKNTLRDYLEIQIRSNSKEYIFYFKLLSLGIESDFKFGDVEIVHLSEKRLQEFSMSYEKTTGRSKVEIESFFDEFRKPVLAVVKSIGVQSRALKDAKYRVGLGISALKIFFVKESLSIADQMFNVDFRFNQIDSFEYMYESTDENFDFIGSMSRTHGSRPIFITNLKLQELNKKGLSKLSEYILKSKEGSLFNEIISSIDHFGKILSNRILHDRIVELVSFFERFTISRDSSRGKGLTRLKSNVLPKIENPGEGFDSYLELINRFYNTRDKYLHNKIELPIDLTQLLAFQVFAIRFLAHLIKFNEDHSELNELYEYFDNR